MSKFNITKRTVRRIIVEQQLYIYSIKECNDGTDILVYKDKQLILWLRQNYIESWGINLFRPKTVELIIKYYQKKGIQSDLQLLSNEKELFLLLTDLFFEDNDEEEKKAFIKRCQNAQ